MRSIPAVWAVLGLAAPPVVPAAVPGCPVTPVCDQVDEFFGATVADPYRWLEDVDSPETLEWISAQNAFTEACLSAIPFREEMRARLRELYDRETCSMPRRVGDSYFYYRNSGLQEHSVLCASEGLHGVERVLLDPNTFPPEEHMSLAGTSISDDGRYLAWGVSRSGSDWVDWQVMDIATGDPLPDTITWTKTSWVSWDAGSTGFYYSRPERPAAGLELTAPTLAEEVFFHRLGTPQDSDSLVFSRPDRPEWFPSAYETDDGRYLIISIYDGASLDHSGLFYVDLALPPGDRRIVELLPGMDASYGFIGNVDSRFYVMTTLDAPRNRIVSIDLEHPQRDAWETIVPECGDILESAGILDGSRTLVLQYSRDAHTAIRFHEIDGTFRSELELPGPGSAWGFGGRQSDTETFYQFTSFLHPGVIYRHDFRTGASEVFWRPDTDVDLSLYESTQVFYESLDGTMIPMFIVRPRGMAMDGSNPTLLTGYGGFGVSMSPYYSASTILWLERGGVYALPCLRGGGEYGEEWHSQAVGADRIKVYQDFICAAEYLIGEGYTSPPHLAIEGGSNGGTLVGACLNLRPDLFAAAVPQMGVMDQLRYHLFTYGWSWIPEYGDPGDPEDFEFLYGLSPYHNIRDGVDYSAVLVTTADHDDRVVPGHSFKYAARLQAAQAGDAPILISICPQAGHGGSVGLSEALDRTADCYSFMLWRTGAR